MTVANDILSPPTPGGSARSAPAGLPGAQVPRRANWAWLGLLPFAFFAALFLILPIVYLVTGAFQTPDGAFTFDNLIALTGSAIAASYMLSIKLSLVSALFGAVAGLLLSWALVLGGLPRWVRGAFVTFSGVASNFAGIPLAFAFIATLGRLGIVTVLMRDVFGFNLYGAGFNLFSFWGLALTYLYFQLPLMVLIITPALDGLKNEWREAAESLGASHAQYWRMVALPVLAPSILGCFLLLFANAFGTLATVYALTGSQFDVVPIMLFAQIRGNVLYNPNLGYALALGMILIAGFSNILYLVLRSRAERWRA
ncbi:ABC transporter permease [Rhizobium rhizosphaerae]|uniref:ABC transporter permease n=1 Tax=Xaviernesmea rhizosphaerae TaxID=1672749 RepID=UPI000A7B9116|nr:ABC transporter permease subunit [Xaviernesmea rhizosphaerae]